MNQARREAVRPTSRRKITSHLRHTTLPWRLTPIGNHTLATQHTRRFHNLPPRPDGLGARPCATHAWPLPRGPPSLVLGLVQAQTCLNRLGQQQAGRKRPSALVNLTRMLNDYLGNPRVAAALAQYEAAWTIFQSLRDVLRLSAQGTSPLGDPYRLTATEQQTLFSSLQELREDCRRRSTEDDDPQQRALCAIVSAHLDRYWDHLPTGTEHYVDRTTNGIETQ